MDLILIITLIKSIAIGIWSHLFTDILQEPGEVFASIRRLVNRIADPQMKVEGRQIPLTKNLTGWRKEFYELMTCSKCLAVWWMLLYFASEYHFGFTAFHQLFLSIIVACFIAYVLSNRI